MRKPRTADVILLALAGWYVQHVVREEKGPGDVFGKLKDRAYAPVHKMTHFKAFVQSLYECIFCAGPYVGVAVLVLWLICPLLIIPLSIAGAIVMLEKYVRS